MSESYKNKFVEYKCLVRAMQLDDFTEAMQELKEYAIANKQVPKSLVRRIVFPQKITGAFDGLDEKKFHKINELIPIYKKRTCDRLQKIKGYDFEKQFKGGASFELMVGEAYWHIMATSPNSLNEKDEILRGIFKFINDYLNKRDISEGVYPKYKRYVITGHIANTIGVKLSEYPLKTPSKLFDCVKNALENKKKKGSV